MIVNALSIAKLACVPHFAGVGKLMSAPIILCSDTRRAVLAVLRPPHDQPGADYVLSVVGHALREFIATLDNPVPQLREWADELAVLPLPGSARTGLLYRRLSRYPVWRLMLSLDASTPIVVMAYVGALNALALVTGTPVPPGRANQVLQLMRSGRADSLPRPIDAERTRVVEALSAGWDAMEVPAETTFVGQIRAYYRALHHFGGEHRHQARPDRRTTSIARYGDAMHELRERVETGEAAAAHIAMCVISGLKPELAAALPLRSTTDADWPAAVDIEAGVYRLDLEVVAPGARAAPGASVVCIQASRVLVRPLPEFLVRALRTHARARPAAITIGELLGNPDVRSTSLVTRTAGPGGFRSSVARIGATTELAAVGFGIGRILASHLAGRYQTVPRSKLYYAAISRAGLWDAAGAFFSAIGWGEPVALCEGPAVGACAVPDDATVARWIAWMRERVTSQSPGRRYTLDSLLRHHHDYALLVGSMFGFLTAGREGAEIALRADAELGAGWLPLRDKRSPSVWNPNADAALSFTVPVTSVLAEQTALWRRHCEALARRIWRLSVPDTQAFAERLEAVAHGDDVAALVVPGKRLTPRVLGTADLVTWWPEWFRLAGNWSRGYWQTRLTRDGVASCHVDVLLRHSQSGTRTMTSTSAESVAQQVRHAARAQARVLAALGCEPVPGLVK